MDTWIGRYRIVETLGKGGMGVVYRARDPELERDVAIKVVLSWAQYDEDAMARFNREARVVAQLQHPHIVTVFDAGRTDDGLPYFVMEYLEGTDLGAVLERQRSLSPARAVGYIRQVCDGLAYAHAREIVHRDIKPANLLITPDDTLKIVDFGIAKLVGAQITGSGISLGTPLYMAPEQVAGRPVDHRADIFAVGGVLYTLLAGHSPFEGPTLGAICSNIESEAPRPLAELGVDVHPRLEAIIQRSLEKTPENRYQTVGALAEELRSVSRELEAAASAPTVVTPQPRAAVAQAEPPPSGRRRLMAGVVLLLIVAAALWAFPGSPLRHAGEQRLAAGEDSAPNDPPGDMSSPAGSDSAVAQSRDSLEAAAANDVEAGTSTDADNATASLEADAEVLSDADDTAPPAAEETATEADIGDVNVTPGTRRRPALYPASSRERAEVNRIAALLVRGLEKKDSTSIAQAFGDELTSNQWSAFSRLLSGPRMKIRYTLGEVGSAADGLVIAEVFNDILFQGPPGRVPAPRKATWVMRLQSDQYGQLKLRSLRQR